MKENGTVWVCKNYCSIGRSLLNENLFGVNFSIKALFLCFPDLVSTQPFKYAAYFKLPHHFFPAQSYLRPNLHLSCSRATQPNITAQLPKKQLYVICKMFFFLNSCGFLFCFLFFVRKWCQSLQAWILHGLSFRLLQGALIYLSNVKKIMYNLCGEAWKPLR